MVACLCRISASGVSDVEHGEKLVDAYRKATEGLVAAHDTYKVKCVPLFRADAFNKRFTTAAKPLLCADEYKYFDGRFRPLRWIFSEHYRLGRRIHRDMKAKGQGDIKRLEWERDRARKHLNRAKKGWDNVSRALFKNNSL